MNDVRIMLLLVVAPVVALFVVPGSGAWIGPGLMGVAGTGMERVASGRRHDGRRRTGVIFRLDAHGVATVRVDLRGIVFGIVVVLVVGMSPVTPPVGFNLFVLQDRTG